MPRQARIDAPGALHPIIARGIERREFFTTTRTVTKLQKILISNLPICESYLTGPCLARASLPFLHTATANLLRRPNLPASAPPTFSQLFPPHFGVGDQSSLFRPPFRHRFPRLLGVIFPLAPWAYFLQHNRNLPPIEGLWPFRAGGVQVDMPNLMHTPKNIGNPKMTGRRKGPILALDRIPTFAAEDLSRMK